MIVTLVGDYHAEVVAHQAIPMAIELAANQQELDVEYEWVRSKQVDPDDLLSADAIWCVPYSPYEDPQAVIAAIHCARENNIPFLGTCAGYQHAALEYARNVLGYDDAESGEDNPDAAMPLIAAMTCRLAGKSDAINIDSGSRSREIYQRARIEEEYNCGFGVNPDYMSIFDGSGLRFTGFDDNGDPRILEIPEHRFFIGTAFQPERSAFNDRPHPLVAAYLQAAA